MVGASNFLFVLNLKKEMAKLKLMSFFFFFNCYLAAPRPTLGHYRGDSLTHPILITAFLHIRPEGHRENLYLFSKQTFTLTANKRLHVFLEGPFSLITTGNIITFRYINPKLMYNVIKCKWYVISAKPKEHPLRISASVTPLGLLWDQGMLSQRIPCKGLQCFFCRIFSSSVGFCRIRIFEVILNIFKSCSKTICFLRFFVTVIINLKKG